MATRKHKICTYCNNLLTNDNWRRCHQLKNYYICKGCKAKNARLYYKSHSKEIIDYQHKHYKKYKIPILLRCADYYKRKSHILVGQIELMLQAARSRARAYKVPFDVKAEDIIIPKKCPILSIRLKRQFGKASDNSPSLDRIIPKLGYVKGNIAIISLKANRIKLHGSAEDHYNIYKWMKKHATKKV